MTHVLRALALACLLPGAALSDTARRLGNLLPYFPVGVPVPGGYVPVGERVFFFSTYGHPAHELWSTDGTTAGTQLVKELDGTLPIFYYSTGAAGETFYFSLDTEDGDRELWRSDGTPAGTHRLKDVNPGPSPSNPLCLGSVGATLVFFARDGQGYGIWRSGGTEETTSRLADVVGIYGRPATVGDTFYFVASDAPHGVELWRTDGTAGGTSVLDVVPGANSLWPTSLFAFRGDLYFTAYQNGVAMLWKSDGTVTGTSVVTQASVDGAAVVGDVFFFFDQPRRELWKSDATAAGTVKVATLPESDYRSSLGSLTAMGGRVYFVQGASNTAQLWRSDGTEAGTLRVGPAYFGIPSPLVPWRNLLFFSTMLIGSPDSTVRSDGTDQGTYPLPASGFGFAGALGEALLLATGTPWAILNTTDGTREGTRTFWPGPLADSGSGSWTTYTERGGLGYFCADMYRPDISPPYQGRRGFLRTDGTPAGTVLLRDAQSCPDPMVRIGDRLLGADYALVSLDPDGVAEVLKDRVSGILGASPSRAFFWTDDTMATSLGVSDGTRDGTYEVSVAPSGHTPYDFVVSSPIVYFQQSGKIWRGAPTREGTFPVTDQIYGLETRLLGGGGGSALFLVRTLDGNEVWFTDGSPGGAVRLKTFVQPTNSLNAVVSPSAAYRDGVYIFGTGGKLGQVQLWQTDGTPAGTVPVRTFVAPPPYSPPADFTVSGPRLFFSACTGDTGCELWVADGAPESARVLDLYPGWQGSRPAELYDASGTLVFSAIDERAGREPWRSDGTPQGTRLAADVAPGPRSSRPNHFARIGHRVVFNADDGLTGAEPWGLELAPAQPTELRPVAPCRVLDTRLPAAAPSPMSAWALRSIPLAGRCGIPTTARAVTVNVTVVEADSAGDVQLFASDVAGSTTSVLAFPAHRTRAASTILSLGGDGSVWGRLRMASGNAHLLLDVSGYFE